MASEMDTQTVPSENQSVVVDSLRPEAELQVLVGGPYTLGEEEHRYGHTALRVTGKEFDLTYDFGRYGRVTGDFGAEGEGILRIWSSFSDYIKGEQALDRETTAFIYMIFEHQAKAVREYYDGLSAHAQRRAGLERGRESVRIFHLKADYHALGYNCTSLSLDGARVVFPEFENGSAEFIKPEKVLTFGERLAMKTVGGGTPGRIFLPDNLKDFLSSDSAMKPVRVDTY